MPQKASLSVVSILCACSVLWGCQRTRVDLRIEASDDLGASELEIVVRDGAGEEVYRRRAAFDANTPAFLPVYDTRGESGFSFELSARDGAGAELATVLGRTDYVPGERREVHLRLCDLGVCGEERCFDAVAAGGGPRSGEFCGPPVDCAMAADGTRCDGERGTCMSGRCCWCFDGGRCVGPEEFSPAMCGRGGEACGACCSGEACDEGTCEVSVSFEHVGVGENMACASTSEGDVYCWGSNEFGALARDDLSLRQSVPTLVDRLGRVSVGAFHVCAQLGSTVQCWGLNDVREAGIPGIDILFEPSVLAGSWREIASGRRHSCGVLSDGTLSCFGGNRDMQLGDPDTPDGTLPLFLPSPSDLSQLSAGFHTMAIAPDGLVYGWGQNVEEEESGVCPACVRRAHQSDGSRWIDVAAGDRFACGIEEGGALGCWGDYLPELFPEGGLRSVPHPRGLAFEQVEAWRSVCALDEEGELWCWGYDLVQNTPEATPRRVSLGGSRWHTLGTLKGSMFCGIADDGALYCFGRSIHGEFGGSGMAMSPNPVRICPAD